ncbi:MAG: integrase, partial [Cyanobacteria bacterium PR.023]|nr:integrase [Cyanobacteria bacterium PR.023]
MAETKLATKRKLTKVVVDDLPHPEKGQQKIYWDSELSGFGVRVTAGAKTYIVEARVDGKTVRVSLGGHGELTADAARKEAKMKLGQMAGGVNLNRLKAERIAEAAAKSLTLGQVLEEYCREQNLRPASVKQYTGITKRCLGDWLDKPLNLITKDMVLKKHRELSAHKGPRSNDTGAHAQANEAMLIFGAIWTYAAAVHSSSSGQPVLGENPVKILKQAKAWHKKVRRQRVIHKHELKAWFDAVESLSVKSSGRIDRRVRDYLLFCLFTGLRRTEAATLKWSNVNLTAGYLKIDADAAKNHEEHRLPLSSFVHQLLAERFEARTCEYVFPGQGRAKGSHLVEVHDSLVKVDEITGVKFSLHDLRRTFINIAEGLDIPHYALKKLVNHKTS